MASALTSPCSTSASSTKVRVRVVCSPQPVLATSVLCPELCDHLQVLSGARASTSGRLPAAAVPQCLQYASIQPPALSGRFCIRPLPGTARLGIAGRKHAVSCGIVRSRSRQVACQAQKSQQETERPVMEQLESDLIAGSSSNGNGNSARRNGSKAPSKNSATNIADKIDTRPAEESQDEGDNNDSGAQSHSERSGGTPAKAASKVPGGVTEGDNLSAPKPASFWLPHPEAGDIVPVQFQLQALLSYCTLACLCYLCMWSLLLLACCVAACQVTMVAWLHFSDLYQPAAHCSWPSLCV